MIGGGSFVSKQLFGKEANIRIFIRANCSEALEPVKVINSKNGGPYIFKTVLGCVLWVH